MIFSQLNVKILVRSGRKIAIKNVSEPILTNIWQATIRVLELFLLSAWENNEVFSFFSSIDWLIGLLLSLFDYTNWHAFTSFLFPSCFTLIKLAVSLAQLPCVNSDLISGTVEFTQASVRAGGCTESSLWGQLMTPLLRRPCVFVFTCVRVHGVAGSAQLHYEY